MQIRFRLLPLTMVFAALFVLALLFIVADVAQAKSVTCDEAGQCVTRCSQTLPDGGFVEYDAGTVITITDKDGAVHTFKCGADGQWVQQTRVLPGSGILGNIGVASIGGVNGTLTSDGYDPIVFGPPGRLNVKGGCNPQQVTCF